MQACRAIPEDSIMLVVPPQRDDEYDKPASLERLCLETICDNINVVFEPYYSDSNNGRCGQSNCFDDDDSDCEARKRKLFRFRDSEVFLFSEISEKLLEAMCARGLLSDSTLSLFNERNTRLKCVRLRDCKKVTALGLEILREHKIVDFECVNVKRVNSRDIIGCLGEWSINNLLNLNIKRCDLRDLKLSETSECSIHIKLTTLKNLRSLNISYTLLTQYILKMICEDLKYLEKLNISNTPIYDLSPLLLLEDRLTSLSICDIKLRKNATDVIIRLVNLRHLDISLMNEELQQNDRSYSDLLEKYDCLPKLVSLDVSGWQDHLSKKTLLKFLEHHPNLSYLGLVLNHVAFDPIFSERKTDLIIAGLANEEHIKVALQRHRDRPLYIQKALYHLFQLTLSFQIPRPDIFNLVLPAMAAHPKKFGVQMAATACLYNLTRSELSKNIHPKALSHGVHLTLNAMEYFPDEYQLQKNSLLTLCSDHILQEVNLERFRCARLVLDSLCTFEEVNMNRMAVAICSILAARVSTAETSQLGARPAYMRKLLAMVQSRVESKTSDVTLKFTLSALWNLTDESAATCKVFLKEGGATLFLNVLKTFKDDNTIETKVLGLLNNIAEVETLRQSLMLNPLIGVLHSLLKSEHIDVSYFAAGIVAHLASDGPQNWSVTTYTREAMLDELGSAVCGWKVPETEMVAYRSFKPFFPLLKWDMDYEVQLWAVWAVHHVCTKNPVRYCQMLYEEQGASLLRELMGNGDVHPDIGLLLTEILEVVSVHVT